MFFFGRWQGNELSLLFFSHKIQIWAISGIESVDLTENTYDIDYVPTPEEHFLRQDPGEQGKIFRPRLMISMMDDEYLRDLGRNVLAGRAVCRDHILNNSMEYHNVSTYYISVVVLNLGNILRQRECSLTLTVAPSDLSLGEIVQLSHLWEQVSPINSFCPCPLIEAPQIIYAEKEPRPCGKKYIKHRRAVVQTNYRLSKEIQHLPSLEKLP